MRQCTFKEYMQRYIVKRILQGLLTLLGLSIVVFILARVGGDPVPMMLGMDAPPEEVQALREKLGLDRPLTTQYWIFITDALRGDFGESLWLKRPAWDVVMEKLPNTLKLTLFASAFAIPIGIAIGVLCALKRNKAFDILGRTLAVLGQSLPGFWIGIMAILLVSVRWEIFPAGGMGGITSYFLPALAMGAFLVAGITRLTRSAMLDVLDSDYITFTRAKGLAETSVILKHALRNASIPVLTFTAIILAHLMAGSIVAETVFAWPGVGRLAYGAVLSRDFPIIQTVVLLYGGLYIFVNLVTDILYAWFDPRIRYQ